MFRDQIIKFARRRIPDRNERKQQLCPCLNVYPPDGTACSNSASGHFKAARQ